MHVHDSGFLRYFCVEMHLLSLSRHFFCAKAQCPGCHGACMAIRQTICESLGGFLCAKSEISPQTQENISNWRSVTERRHISRDLTDRFSLNFPDRSMTTRQTICASFNRFLCAKSEISLQTQDNISIWRCVAEHRHISVDLTDRSSLNFSDSCRAIRLTISQNTR